MKSPKSRKPVKPSMVMNVICIIFITAFLSLPFIVRPFFRMTNLPAQSEEVKVESKRIKENYRLRGGKSGSSRTHYYYYITFKFQDGSTKEFEAGRPDSFRGRLVSVPNNASNKSAFYNTINEGDVGVLTYKQSGERLRFESFEKDGVKIEPYKQGDANEDKNMIICVAIVCPPIYAVIIWMMIREWRKWKRSNRTN